MELTRFDMQKEATQKRIAMALERIAAALEELAKQERGARARPPESLGGR